MEEKPEEKILRISSKSAEYPEKLNNYPKMPEILFVKRRLPDRKKPSIAIVGARACSTYGRIQAFRYAKVLSSAGVQIISGMAYGIDAEAHWREEQQPTQFLQVVWISVIRREIKPCMNVS